MPKSKELRVMKQKHCVFCDIIDKKRQHRDIVLQNDQAIVFHDISPAATYHLLSCPVVHIKDCKHLTKTDIALVKQLEKSGLEALSLLGADIQDSRCGFHWPPYNSIFHLHLHVLSPASRVRSHRYTAGGKAFKTVNEVISHLQKLPDPEESKTT